LEFSHSHAAFCPRCETFGDSYYPSPHTRDVLRTQIHPWISAIHAFVARDGTAYAIGASGSFCQHAQRTSKSIMSEPVLWETMTWEELATLRRSGMDAALFPVGATEQHGPHLSTSVDSVTAEQLAHAVSAETGVPVLPTLPYGCSLGHSRRWPGTLALQPQTLIAAIVEVAEWAYHSGFRRIVLINGHVTNFAPLRCALEVLRSRFDDLLVAIRNVADLSPRVQAEFFADAQDWHANASETSLMQALAPHLVREEKVAAADDPDRTEGLFFSHPVNRTSANGVTGFPSRATAESGRRLFRMMVEDLAGQVRAALTECPPLPQSYFATVCT
jgi:creatinine amidohydrolase